MYNLVPLESSKVTSNPDASAAATDFLWHSTDDGGRCDQRTRTVRSSSRVLITSKLLLPLSDIEVVLQLIVSSTAEMRSAAAHEK
jgi:hypothetical protein